MEERLENHSEESDNDNADDVETENQVEDSSKFILSFIYIKLDIIGLKNNVARNILYRR